MAREDILSLIKKYYIYEDLLIWQNTTNPESIILRKASLSTF